MVPRAEVATEDAGRRARLMTPQRSGRPGAFARDLLRRLPGARPCALEGPQPREAAVRGGAELWPVQRKWPERAGRRDPKGGVRFALASLPYAIVSNHGRPTQAAPIRSAFLVLAAAR